MPHLKARKYTLKLQKRSCICKCNVLQGNILMLKNKSVRVNFRAGKRLKT